MQNAITMANHMILYKNECRSSPSLHENCHILLEGLWKHFPICNADCSATTKLENLFSKRTTPIWRIEWQRSWLSADFQKGLNLTTSPLWFLDIEEGDDLGWWWLTAYCVDFSQIWLRGGKWSDISHQEQGRYWKGLEIAVNIWM